MLYIQQSLWESLAIIQSFFRSLGSCKCCMWHNKHESCNILLSLFGISSLGNEHLINLDILILGCSFLPSNMSGYFFILVFRLRYNVGLEAYLIGMEGSMNKIKFSYLNDFNPYAYGNSKKFFVITLSKEVST